MKAKVKTRNLEFILLSGAVSSVAFPSFLGVVLLSLLGWCCFLVPPVGWCCSLLHSSEKVNTSNVK